MNKFDRLLDRGLEHFAEQLAASHHDDANFEELTDLVSELNFPALLAFLATSENASGPLGPELLRQAAASVASAPPFPGLGIASEDVERVLTEVLVHRASPGAGAQLRDQILEKGVEAALDQLGVPVTPGQARRVARLLATGEFYRDVADATAAIAFTVPGIPIELVKDARRLPSRIPRLLLAVTRDVGGSAFSVPVIFGDLLDGRLDNPPVILRHTFAALYRFGSVASTAKMLADLLHPDNETLRLAVLIYARTNGIPLDEGDLDLLRTSLFDTAQPDLGPVLVRAFERLEKEIGGDEVAHILARMDKAET